MHGPSKAWWIGAIILIALAVNEAVAEYLKWTPPITREDGSPLDPRQDLQEYRLYCGTRITYIPALTEGYTYPVDAEAMLPGPGDHLCYLTAVDKENIESKPSNTVVISSTMKPPVTSPPSGPTQFIMMTGVPPTLPPDPIDPVDPPPEPVEGGTIYVEIDPRDMNYSTAILVNNQSTEFIQSLRMTIPNAVMDFIRPGDGGDFLLTSPAIGGNNDDLTSSDLILNFDPPITTESDWTGVMDIDGVGSVPLDVTVELRLLNGKVLKSRLTNMGDSDDENGQLYIHAFDVNTQ